MTPVRLILSFAVLLAVNAVGQTESGIDPEALIDRILMTDRQQRERVRDIVFDAEYVEREDKGKEGIKEKERFLKKVYVKYLQDTTWYHEEYLEYYRDGKLKDRKELEKKAAERMEKKRKRKTRDVSFNMLEPFYPERRELYDISYVGVADETVEDCICYYFRVIAKEKADSLLNGEYYFEAKAFHLVRVDFSPAKLVKKMMFKLKELNISITYGPTDEDFWLPREFTVQGKGKAAFFFGVKFTGTEYYRNPVVNGGLDDSVFEGDHGSK